MKIMYTDNGDKVALLTSFICENIEMHVVRCVFDNGGLGPARVERTLHSVLEDTSAYVRASAFDDEISAKIEQLAEIETKLAQAKANEENTHVFLPKYRIGEKVWIVDKYRATVHEKSIDSVSFSISNRWGRAAKAYKYGAAQYNILDNDTNVFTTAESAAEYSDTIKSQLAAQAKREAEISIKRKQEEIEKLKARLEDEAK